MQASAGEIDHLLELWLAQCVLTGGEPPFRGVEELYSAIDSIKVGDANWQTFSVKYTGPIDANSPSWMKETYVVHHRNPLKVLANQVGNPDFDGKFDYVAYEEYTAQGQRRWSNIMSGHWAKKKLVSSCFVHYRNSF
jgi:hypothetical protein